MPHQETLLSPHDQGKIFILMKNTDLSMRYLFIRPLAYTLHELHHMSHNVAYVCFFAVHLKENHFFQKEESRWQRQEFLQKRGR